MSLRFPWRVARTQSTANHRRPPSRSPIIVMVFMLMSMIMTAMPTAAQTATVTPPIFSVPRGFPTSAFDLTLSSPGANIRYTLDGSTPSPSSGTLYSKAIQITKTTVVRAIAYTSSSVKSPVLTNSYIFLAGVRTQADSQPGWPTEFAAPDTHGSYPADYEMDPEVLNPTGEAAGYAISDSKFNAIMKSLPTLSVVTDQPNLWDPSFGIYANPGAKEPYVTDPKGTKWERPVSLEWINPDGTTGFVENAGARMQGQASRRPQRTPKHSFRIYFKKAYSITNQGSLKFPLFDAPDAEGSYDRLVLRNGGNRSWPYFDRDQRREADYVNDEWARRAWGQMGNLTSHGTYVQLYLNGLYWGLYNVAERIDEKFLAANLGLTELDYDVIEPAEELNDAATASAGTIDAWNELLNLVKGNAPITDAQYKTITTKLDVVNFADYFVHVYYIGKTDWPDINWNMYRARIGPDTRFKAIAWDNDSGLNKLLQNTTQLTETVVNGVQDSPWYVFNRLTSNAEFKQVLTDRLYRNVIDPTGALTPANCVALYTQLTNTIDQAVIGESARWGDYSRDKYPPTNPIGVGQKPFPAYLYSRDLPTNYTDPTGVVTDSLQETWVNVRDDKLSSYCPNRSTVVAGQFRDNGWYTTPITVPLISQRGGTVASGSVSLNNSLNNNAGDIYYTTNGVDPRAEFGAVAQGAMNGGDAVTINIPRVTVVKARVWNGTDWSPLLEYTFAPAQQLQNLVINEIHYNPAVAVGADPKQYEFIELYNKGTTPLQLDSVSFLRSVNFQFPANTDIQPGQFLVLASNPAAFQQRYGFAPFGGYTGSLANEGETVELIDAVGGTIDSVTYGIAAPWPTEPNGLGNSLSLYSPTLDNSSAANWRASIAVGNWPASGGTPGAPNGFVALLQVPNITWANPAAITYGTPLGSAQLNATATSNGQPVEGTFSYTPALGTMLSAGNGQTLSVTFTPNDSATYAEATATVLIDVAKAPLTITADSKFKRIGAENPALTASYSGFVNGDDAADLDTPAVLNTTATTDSPEGIYPITVTGATDGNYDITFVEGTLTVTNKAIPTITWARPAPITSGTPLGSAQLNATATSNGQPVAGTFTYTPAAGAVLPAGKNQVLSVTFTPADANAYATVKGSVTIDVLDGPGRAPGYWIMLPMIVR